MEKKFLKAKPVQYGEDMTEQQHVEEGKPAKAPGSFGTSIDLEARIKSLRSKFDDLSKITQAAAPQPSRYDPHREAEDFQLGGGYNVGAVKVLRPPPGPPAKVSEAQRKAIMAIDEVQSRLDMVARFGQGGMEIETYNIELGAAKEAMSNKDFSSVSDIAGHILKALDERFSGMLKENTSKELARAYSLLSGARTLGLEVGRQAKLIEEAQGALLSDDLSAANRIINEVIHTLTETKHNFLKREVERLLGCVFEIMEVVSVMESEIGEVRGIFEHAQGLYQRENLEEAYRVSNQAHELAKNLKDLYFQRYCIQAMSDLRAKMTIAGSFSIDTAMHRELISQLERQSLSKANIIKMRELAQQVGEAKQLLEDQITSKLKVSAMDGLRELEDLCQQAKALNVFTRKDQERLERVKSAMIRQDFLEFETIKNDLGHKVKAHIQRVRQRNSKDALVLVGEVRNLIKDAEDKQMDATEAKKTFEQARGLVSKGDYQMMIRLCNKAKNGLVTQIISRQGPTAQLQRMLIESDELKVRKKRLQDITEVLADLKAARIDVSRIDRVIKETQAILDKGDVDTTDNHLLEIETGLGELGNEVWINQAMNHLQKSVQALKATEGLARDKERLCALHNKALKHIESNEFLDAIWAIKEISG